jgi:hypothetical protein
VKLLVLATWADGQSEMREIEKPPGYHPWTKGVADAAFDQLSDPARSIREIRMRPHGNSKPIAVEDPRLLLEAGITWDVLWPWSGA